MTRGRTLDSANAIDGAERSSRAPRGVVWFAYLLATTAVGAGIVLLGDGRPVPALGPLLVLAVVVGISVNRVAFFPSELSATAEAAALFSAMVWFQRDASLLGPLAVALLVGPLDALHWEQRSFVRMAYNSGSQGVSVLLSAALFHELHATWGGALPAVLAAAAVASVPYVVTDSALGVALLMLHRDTTVRSATRHQVSINGLALPLAWYGAAVGWLVLDRGAGGWWLAAAMLAPTPFLPELVLVRARRRWRAGVAHGYGAGAALVIGLTALAVVFPLPDGVTLVLLLACAIGLGAELRADRRAIVPPLVSLIVVAAVVVTPWTGALLAAALGAAVATLTSWAGAGATRDHAWPAGALAALAGLLAACTFRLLGTATTGSGDAVGRAVVAAVAFELVVVVGSRARRRELERIPWTMPVLVVAASLAEAWRMLGARGGVLFGAGVTLALATVHAAGAPPWNSRVLRTFTAPVRRSTSRRTARTAGRLRAGTIAVALGSALAADATDGRSRVALAAVAAAAGAGVIAQTAVTVRQWRFAPRRRAIELGALVGASVALIGASSALVHPVDPRLLAGVLAVPTAIGLLLDRSVARSTRHALGYPGFVRRSLERSAQKAAASLGIAISHAPARHSCERELQRLIRSLGVDCILDVGAHHGEFAARLRSVVHYRGTIVSFEPAAEAFAILNRRMSGDANWSATCLALGEEEGQANLRSYAAATDFNSFYEPSSFGHDRFRLAEPTTETVPVTRLDTMLAKLAIDPATRTILLKTDTQGHDVPVLRGAGSALQEIAAIVMEISVVAIYDDIPLIDDVIRELRDLGFDPTGFFPVSRDTDTLRVIEFDCTFVNRRLAAARAATPASKS